MAVSDRLGIRHFAKSEAPAQSVWREGYVDVHAKDFPTGEIKGAVLGLNDEMAAILGLAEPGSVIGPTQAFGAYEKSSAVSIPINMVTEQLAKMNPILQNMETGETQRKSEVLDILRRPHPLFPRSRFFETCGKYYLVAAEIPIVGLGRISKPPIMLQPLNPKMMSPVPDMSMGFARSWIKSGIALSGQYNSRPRDLGSEFFDGGDRRLKMIIGFSTKDDALLRGQSKLVSGSKEIWQQIEGANYNLQLLKQGGRPSLVFHFKGTMGRDEFMETRKLILSQVEGAQNAGRVLVTRGNELDIHEGTNNNREMEYQDGQKSARQVMFQLFKVPLVLSSTDAATFNNFETAQLTLWDDAVIPLFQTITGELGDWLLPMYGIDPDIWRIWFDESEIEVLADRALTRRERRAKSGVETVNEIRKDIPGAEPQEGGDEILVNGTQVPLSAVTAPPLDVPLPGSPGGTPSPSDAAEDDKPEDDDAAS